MFIITAVLSLITLVILLAIFLNYYWVFVIKSNPVDNSTAVKEIDYKYELYPPEMNSILERFKLNEILDNSSDLSIALSAMKWIHSRVRHTSNPVHSGEINSHIILENVEEKVPMINCWMYSILLSELLLAKGIPSRIVHLRPKDFQTIDSHVVVSAFIASLKKWIFLDPNFNAYLTDRNGSILGVQEIRDNMARGKQMQVNEDAKYLGDEPISNFLSHLFGNKYYVLYLKKNFFRYSTPLKNAFNNQTKGQTNWVHVVRDTYINELKKIGKIKDLDIVTNNTKEFWKIP